MQDEENEQLVWVRVKGSKGVKEREGGGRGKMLIVHRLTFVPPPYSILLSFFLLRVRTIQPCTRTRTLTSKHFALLAPLSSPYAPSLRIQNHTYFEPALPIASKRMVLVS